MTLSWLLFRIKKKDPQIYDTKVQFFQDKASEEEVSAIQKGAYTRDLISQDTHHDFFPP
jgi:hypothetical protein